MLYMSSQPEGWVHMNKNILFLVRIMSASASAFISVHYHLSQSADFDQTSIDTFLGEGKEMIIFW